MMLPSSRKKSKQRHTIGGEGSSLLEVPEHDRFCRPTVQVA
jgi:hypothetical protein